MITLTVAASAAPTFVGEPEDVALAEHAWAAAAACTGREGLAAATVEITRRTNAGDYLGIARTDPSGRLYRIDLNVADGRRGEVVVHEVSHAWVSDGPVALVEGTAERIADCVVGREPGLAPLQFDDGRDLAGMPDLVTWSKPTEDAPSELYSVRTVAYVGASRLLRTAEQVLPASQLWTDRTVSWEGFLAALDGAGERGAALAAVVRGGAAAQRRALADDDRDGLTAIAEAWLGTDDRRFDTDGDGWWDGAVHPDGALAVPLDGTPLCAGNGPLVVGGDLRGPNLPTVAARRVGGAGPRPSLVSLSGPLPIGSTGGAWAVAPRTASPACASSLRATVWAEDPALDRQVRAVHDALVAAMAEADARWEAGPQRVALAIGGGTTGWRGEVVWLARADVERALAAGGAAEVARTAVAARRLWVQGDLDWAAVEAVAASLRD